MKKKKKQNQVNKFKDFMKTLKPILIFSMIINIILLSYVYYLKTSHHLYLLNGTDQYLDLNTGTISLNYDINVLGGNGIRYINETDYKITEIKIGYYLMKNDKLEKIIAYEDTFKKEVSLKETIENITSFNITENANHSDIFKNLDKDILENNLYLVMEAKTSDKTISSKILLDVITINE